MSHRSLRARLDWIPALAYLTLGVGFLPCVQANVFLNGSFSQGGVGWESLGAVEFDHGFADLSDANESHLSRIHQLAAFASEGIFSFEFLPEVSGAVPFGTPPDTVFVSLYFVDDPLSFDLDAGVFDDALLLMQVDRAGVQVFDGELQPGTLGPGWQAFSVEIVSTNRFVVPVVELFGENEVDDDSRFLVDRFTIRVDRILLFPRLTSFDLVKGQGRAEFSFEDSLGHEDDFTVEFTEQLDDTETWAPINGVTVDCLSPGSFRGAFPLPAVLADRPRFYRVYPK